MLKKFTSDLWRNVTKLICLTVGLAIGSLMLAKAYYNYTYDSFLPEHERTYMLREYVNYEDRPIESFRTSGGLAPAMAGFIPQVDIATRFTPLMPKGQIMTECGRYIDVEGVNFADTCFFRMFPRCIISGDVDKSLVSSDLCIIPNSLAVKLGGDVIGSRLSLPEVEDNYPIIVGAVYEDFPENSIMSNAILMSMNAYPYFFDDDRNDLYNNDCYSGFIRLKKDVPINIIEAGVKEMLDNNISREILDITDYRIDLIPISEVYLSDKTVRMENIILLSLAAIILLCASINFLLIVFGQTVNRIKEMAVRKCYGTTDRQLFGIIMGESIAYLTTSSLLAILLILSMKNICIDITGISPRLLFSTPTVWIIEGSLTVILLLITGVIPAYIYCRTSIASTFQAIRVKRGKWKIALLAVQFYAVGLLTLLLIIAGRQSYYIAHIDHGYDYDNVAMVYVNGCSADELNRLKMELERLGSVRKTAFATHNFICKAGGNTSRRYNGDQQQRIVIEDLKCADVSLFDVLGLEFIQGESFPDLADSQSNLIVVDENFARQWGEIIGNPDQSVIGESFRISQHGDNECVVCGIIRNFRRGGIENDNSPTRPAVIFSGNDSPQYLYIRYNALSPAAIAESQSVIDRIMPDRNLHIDTYRSQIARYSENIRKFCQSCLVVGIAIMLIALSGLVGYTSDEINRRSKEIAIRKINGTSVGGILKMLCLDILKIAVPTLAAGGVTAYVAGKVWLSYFSEQAPLEPLILASGLVILLLIIICVVAWNSLAAARSNPINYLKNAS